MKSPAELTARLVSQWQRNDLRVQRLLGKACWPLRLPIGKPTAIQLEQEPARVQQHIRSWREQGIGQVEYESVRFRRLAEPLELPVTWRLERPSDWVRACRDAQVQQEFATLSALIAASDDCMHERLVRERSLWRNKAQHEVLATIKLANQLEPGCAGGQPLRLLSGYGVDTKFVERHETLLRRLLDARFAGAASEQGLAVFLDAPDDKDHWLLVRPLAEGLLPFGRLRLTTQVLAQTPLPTSRILVVENEQCEHLLPPVPDCIAILGSGLDLTWLSGPALQGKQVYYWGDLDTWGLTMLARARQHCPGLQAVLMDTQTFASYASFAVCEPQPASGMDLTGLTHEEQELFRQLQGLERGRLEQEFLPAASVQAGIEHALFQGFVTASC